MTGKNKKEIWQVAAFFPWMILLSFLIVHFTLGFTPIKNQSFFGITLWIFFAIALFVIWLAFSMHAWVNKSLIINERLLWLYLFFFLNIFVYPIYWWKQIKNIPEKNFQSADEWNNQFNIDPDNALESKLSILASYGLKLAAPFTAKNLIDSWGKEEYDNPGFEEVIYGLATVEEDVPWRNHCVNLWLLDTECIEGNNAYKAIALRMMELTQGSLVLEDINDHIDVDNETAWLSFVFRGETIRIDCTFNEDWLDVNVFTKFIELLEIIEPAKVYINYPTDGQDCIIGCVTRDQLKMLNTAGIEFALLNKEDL